MLVHYKGYLIEKRGRAWFWYLDGEELSGDQFGVSLEYCKEVIDEK